MRTTIRMSEPLASQVNELARKRRRSFTDLAEEALFDLLRKHRSPPRKKRAVLPVLGGGERRISAEKLKRAVAEADFEDDIRKIAPSHAPAQR